MLISAVTVWQQCCLLFCICPTTHKLEGNLEGEKVLLDSIQQQAIRSLQESKLLNNAILFLIRIQRGKGPSIKHITLEGGGGPRSVIVCERGVKDHVTSHL